MKFWKIRALRLGTQIHVANRTQPAVNGRIIDDEVAALREQGYELEPHDGTIPGVDHEALELANRNADHPVFKSASAESEYLRKWDDAKIRANAAQ